MILTEVQNYLAQRGKASLSEMEVHFRTDGEALRGMLNRLVRKGRVNKQCIEKCGGCSHCQTESFELYEWVGKNN